MNHFYFLQDSSSSVQIRQIGRSALGLQRHYLRMVKNMDL